MATIGRDRERVDLVLGKPGGPMTATLVADGLRASHEVEPNYIDNGFRDLADYFTDLERSWRGWNGERSWRSLEGELSIDARHTGSHVVLEFKLANGPLSRGAEWSARLDLTVDAGEELAAAAAGVRALAG